MPNKQSLGPLGVAAAASMALSAALAQTKQSAAQYAGYVDICSRSRVVGWAIDGFKGVAVDVKVNGRTVGRATKGLVRPDVAKAVSGAPANVGFEFIFSPALKATDKVEVTFANGQQLVNSPCKKLD